MNGVKASWRDARTVKDLDYSFLRRLGMAARARTAPHRLLATFFIFALGGCSLSSGTSAEQAEAQVEWSAAEEAVLIQVDADDHLNEVGTEAHTLLLAVVQTADADSFRKLATDPANLATALSGSVQNPTILQVTRYVIQPGGRTLLSVDRSAKTKVVGLIAGYYVMATQSSARLFEIPLEISNHATFGHDYVAQPQTLTLHVVLGRTAITTAVRLNPEPQKIVAEKARAHAKQEIVPLDGGGKEVTLTPITGQPDAAALLLPN